MVGALAPRIVPRREAGLARDRRSGVAVEDLPATTSRSGERVPSGPKSWRTTVELGVEAEEAWAVTGEGVPSEAGESS